MGVCGCPLAPNFPAIPLQQKEQMYEGDSLLTVKNECHPMSEGRGMGNVGGCGRQGVNPQPPPGASPSSWGLWGRKSLTA